MFSIQMFTINSYVVFQCLPIVSLIASLLEKFDSLKDLKRNNHAFGILVGLVFSVFADALLVYDEEKKFFLAGMDENQVWLQNFEKFVFYKL